MRATLVVACAALFATVRAKESTRKLIVTGETLAGPVELTDAGTLALSDLYRGTFLDTTHEVSPPGPDAARYEISFYLPRARDPLLRRLFERGATPLVRAYVVSLALDTARGTRSVYLPGTGDSWAGWNRGTIVRSRLEGRWYAPSAAWGDAVTSAIARARRRRPPACPSQREALVMPSDAAYRDLSSLVRRLDERGVSVLCAYRTTLDGMLGDARALGLMTASGPVAVFTFANAAEAASVGLSTSVLDGQLVTVVSAPGRQRPDSVFGADRLDFVRYDHWVIDTFQQPALRIEVVRALTGG